MLLNPSLSGVISLLYGARDERCVAADDEELELGPPAASPKSKTDGVSFSKYVMLLLVSTCSTFARDSSDGLSSWCSGGSSTDLVVGGGREIISKSSSEDGPVKKFGTPIAISHTDVVPAADGAISGV